MENQPLNRMFNQKYVRQIHRLRIGSTVVEVVIACAISAIFISLALPVVQSLREAARNTVCQDRLAQNTFDAALFESINGRLPCHLSASGAVAWSEWSSSASPEFWARQQSTSPLAEIANLSEGFDIDPLFFDFNAMSEEVSFFELPGWDEWVALKRNRFRCGSSLNRITPVQGTILATQSLYFEKHDLGTDYIGLLPANGSATRYGTTDFLGVMGFMTGGENRAPTVNWQYRGMITNREIRTLDEVTAADGLSNTFMFGETIGGRETFDNQATTTYLHSWASGGLGRGRGLTNLGGQSTSRLPMLGHALKASPVGFGSFHPGTVNFSMGDGAVQAIARTIDVDTFAAMCGAFDTQ